MLGRLKQPGYRLYAVDSPEAEAVLADVGVSRADLDCALAALERSRGIRVRSIVGINYDAVFGSTREGWRPDLGDQLAQRPPGDRQIIHPQNLTKTPGNDVFLRAGIQGFRRRAPGYPPPEFRGHTQSAARPVPPGHPRSYLPPPRVPRDAAARLRQPHRPSRAVLAS